MPRSEGAPPPQLPPAAPRAAALTSAHNRRPRQWEPGLCDPGSDTSATAYWRTARAGARAHEAPPGVGAGGGGGAAAAAAARRSDSSRWIAHSTQQHWPFPADKTETGYAYVLTHPGTPCIFYDDLFSHGEKLRELVALRKRADLTSRSNVEILAAEADMYVARIDKKCAAAAVCFPRLLPDGMQYVLNVRLKVLLIRTGYDGAFRCGHVLMSSACICMPDSCAAIL